MEMSFPSTSSSPMSPATIWTSLYTRRSLTPPLDRYNLHSPDYDYTTWHIGITQSSQGGINVWRNYFFLFFSYGFLRHIDRYLTQLFFESHCSSAEHSKVKCSVVHQLIHNSSCFIDLCLLICLLIKADRFLPTNIKTVFLEGARLLNHNTGSWV